MRQVTAMEVHARAVEQLGLSAWPVDLTCPEVIAAALRRAAGFLCPCAPSALVRAIVRSLEALCDEPTEQRAAVEHVLASMIAHGDLLEGSRSPDEPASGIVYAAPPAFVVRRSGGAMLLGVAPDHASPLPCEIESRLVPVEHLRRLPPDALPDAAAILREFGLIELSYERWLGQPTAETAPLHLQRFDMALDATRPSNEVPGLTIVDPTRRVDRYRERWVVPRDESGRFVGRRAQAYGADLWCYVELRGGVPLRFVDLPLRQGRDRGCDEAWHLQLAIDAVMRHPQRCGVRADASGAAVLELWSPLPAWAQRRWDAVGEPCRVPGALFAYRFEGRELAEEVRFARDVLWLATLGAAEG